MYTRFKSQNSGIKIGLNTITNNSRTRVALAQTTNTINNDANKKIDTNNNTTNVPVSPSINSVLTTTACLVLDEIDLKYDTTKESKTPLDLTAYTLVKENSKSKENSKYKQNKKAEKNNFEETIDNNCIAYVKSMWEEYSNEIGTEDGPLRHVDESSKEYPHLNGFVAFDMEHWWAERSISCMINEKASLESINELNQTEILNDYNKKESNLKNKRFNSKSNSYFSIQKTMQNISLSQVVLS